eukprot:gene7893-12361_t
MTDRAETFWNEFAIKTTSIILNSRIPFPLDVKKREASKWFNINVPEIKDVCSQLQQTFKTNPNTIYLDIYVTVESEGEKKSTLLERWIMSRNSKDQSDIDTNQSYIDSCILMRALYSTVMFMPSYKLYRKCMQHRRGNIQLSFYMDSSEPIGGGFSSEEQNLKINFKKINTSFGSMNISVEYRKTVKIEMRETVSKPIQIVSNHFGSHSQKKKEENVTSQEIMKNLSRGSVGGGGGGSGGINIPKKHSGHDLKGLIQQDSFSKSPPFSKTYETDSPLSQPSSLNSPPFESMLTKQFNSQGSMKKSFKISFSPFVDSPMANYQPGTKIQESMNSPRLFERIPPTPTFTTNSSPITKRNSIEEAPPFLNYNLNEDEDKEFNETTSIFELEDSGLTFAMGTGMSGLKGSESGYDSDDSEDEEVSTLIRQIDNAPKLISFSDQDPKLTVSLNSLLADLSFLQSDRVKLEMSK